MAVLIAIPALPARAQVTAPWEGGVTTSLGQPRPWKWTLGAAVGTPLSGPGGVFGQARAGLYHDLMNPMLSLAALHGEAYAGERDGSLDAGVRLRFASQAARFGAGLDYNVTQGRVRPILSILHPGRRGGVFRDGSYFRLDWMPGDDHGLMASVEFAAFRLIPMGSTRPRRDRVSLPTPSGAPRGPGRLPGPVRGALADARDHATWIRRLTLPVLEHDAAGRLAAEAATIADLYELKRWLRDGDGERTPESATYGFHSAIERAFLLALGPASADDSAPDDGIAQSIAAHAREVLLDEVLLPYNRLLGQVKRHDGLHGLADRARNAFLIRLHTATPVDRQHHDALLGVFDAMIAIIEDNRAAARRDWDDSRFVWLPLQYALLPEQHDTHAEVDALIERAVGTHFTEGNFVSWLINEQFQYHLARTIREAEDYHVLWTHDFRGIDGQGDPDEMAYRQVLHAYLRALTDRVQLYDRTGRMPVYIILLDEWFYQVNRGRFWLNLLENPLGHTLRLPPAYSAWQDSIAAAQAALHEAVASSSLLQRQRREFGDAWLRSLVKVHVNITNPADPSFWSNRVLRHVPLPDNMMRDHRKIVFYDLSEEDPYRGAAIYTGAGVGEHYASLSWEDRSIIVRGPAVLGLKAAARDALAGQGVAPGQIPWPLQPRPLARDYEARIAREIENNQQPVRALEVHNATGFGTKDANVVKAILYTLMPPGSVIKIPDSLWNSPFWGAAIAGCAVRGVRVLMIAPAAGNAPAPGFGTLARARDLVWALLQVARVLEEEIERAGGLLRVGIYSPDFEVTDIPAKVRSAQDRFAAEPWLRGLFGFPPEVYSELEALTAQLSLLSLAPDRPLEFEHEARPLLHLKANYFASAEAWTLMTRPEWASTMWEFVTRRIAQVAERRAAVHTFDLPEDDRFIDVGDGMVRSWFGSLDPRVRERAMFYTILGSQNQNSRSMVIDGEVAFVMSGWPAVIPYLDLIALIGASRWISTPAELDALLPPPSDRTWRLARWSRLVL